VTCFIQLAPSAEPESSAIPFRSGFENWAREFGEPSVDQVVLYTHDSEEVSRLHAIWGRWAHVTVKVAHPCITGVHQSPETAYIVRGTDWQTVSLNPFDAMKWSPSSSVKQVLLPVEDLAEVLASLQSSGQRISVCVDLRVAEHRQIIDHAAHVASICIVTADVAPSIARNLQIALKAAGLRPAGRPFGHAGASIAHVHPASPAMWLRSLLAEGRVRCGMLVEALSRKSKQRTLWRVLSGLPSPRRDRLVNYLEAEQLHPVPRSEINTFLEQVRSQPDGSWRVAGVPEIDPDTEAQVCHERLGVWPISFSYPTSLPLREPIVQLSPIIPGFPYSFTDNQDYLTTYANARMALTFRKAGWDCFRHVEILASGCVPVMLDADAIPRFAMVHYPKNSMARVAAQARAEGGGPDSATQAWFRQHFDKYLTTRAMAQYLLRMSGLEGAQRVLFIDDQVPVNPEYQSTLTLIGLKQLLGTGCEVAFPGQFLYVDRPDSAVGFYGRGFGYSHVLQPGVRTLSEEAGISGHGLEALNTYEAVIVGSISRNRLLARRVMESCDPRRVIIIHGEDTPPSVEDLREIRESRVHAFVRAIHIPG
jgi:hypothetical protein